MSILTRWFGENHFELNEEVRETAERFKTVAEFLEAGIEKIGEISEQVQSSQAFSWLARALEAVVPWTEVAGEALPPVKALAKLLEKATKETKPEALGLLACTTAYQRAIEESVKELRTLPPGTLEGAGSDGSAEIPSKARHARDAASDARELSKKFAESEIATQESFSWFSLEQPLAHPFTENSRNVLKYYATEYFYDAADVRRLITAVDESFPRVLKAILSDGGLRAKFEPFRTLITLGTNEARQARAIKRHCAYQDWLFKSRPVFSKETFSLRDILVEPDCGALTWRAIRDGLRIARLEDRIDPFVETSRCGGRTQMLNEVLRLIGSAEHDDAIVIQGVAGSGKSSFTLRLCNALSEQGLVPLRIRFRDLPLDTPLFEAISEAIGKESRAFGDSTDAAGRAAFNPDSLRTSVSFGETSICPYVFIFDGWDEISVTAKVGFNVQVEALLGDIRRELIQRGGMAPIRVIVTGRPSVDVNESRFLRPGTPVLTVRPFTPEQLREFAGKFTSSALDVLKDHEMAAPWPLETQGKFEGQVNKLLKEYGVQFEQAVREAKPGASGLGGSLTMLGLPLLAHLAFRLVTSEKIPVPELTRNPTALYRRLVDLTCAYGGNPANEDRDSEPRLAGNTLRELLRRTAAAMTIRDREAISYKELEARLKMGRNLDAFVREITEANPLSELLIGFFFRAGNRELGCEFSHKSFREYFFAEAITETLKAYGRKKLRNLPRRTLYGRDFDSADERHKLRLNLAMLLGPQWISAEIAGHLEQLVEWEIKRAFGGIPITENDGSEPLERAEWECIREGLADLWDWWIEGAPIRPQPRIDPATDNLVYDEPLANHLVKVFARRDLPQGDLPLPIRLATVDSHLGDGLFRLCTLTHYWLATETGWLGDAGAHDPAELWEGVGEPGAVCRPYQVLIRRAERTWTMFAPSGDDGRYIGFAANRINGAGWRPHGHFPSGIDMRGTFLKRCELASPSQRSTLGRPTRWDHCNLEEYFGVHSVYWGDTLTEVYAPRAELWSSVAVAADFTRADLSGANLVGSNFDNAVFDGATLKDANLGGVRANSASFRGACLDGADFRGSTLKGAVFDVERIGAAKFERTAGFSGAATGVENIARAEAG